MRSFWPTWMSRSSAIASINSWVLTAFSAASRASASNFSRELPSASSAAANFGLVVVQTVDGVVHRLVDLGLHDGLRQRHLHEFQQRLEGVIAGSSRPAGSRLTRRTCSSRLPRVPRWCRIRLPVARIRRRPRQLPLLDRLEGDGDLGLLAGVLTGDQLRVVNVFDSPSDRPTIASSRPSMSWPEPTSWDSPSVLASARSSPLTVAERSIGDEVALLGRAFYALERAEAGAQCLQLRLHLVIGDRDGIDRIFTWLRSGSSMSGRTSTSAVKTSSSPSSILVTSMSG